MKKITIIIYLALFIQLNLNSQSCLPEGITFTTQAEIDNFQSNYPNCTEIEGSVNIISANITNLNGLNVLTAVGGSLSIGIFATGGNPYLTTLTGLDNITTIGGDLFVDNNETLINLSGLQNLTTIGGSLGIVNNPVLASLTSLSNLTSIGGYLEIKSNNELTNLNGLESITSIGWDLTVSYNYGLTSLAGLENINASTISVLYIYNNISLTECAAKTVCNFLEIASSGDIVIQDNNTGCNSQTEVELDCSEGGLGDVNSANTIIIYPNPAKEKIYLTGIDLVNVKEVIIYNQLGQPVLSESQFINVIDLSNLCNGIYIIELITKEMNIRGKLIVR